jgi:p-hydroxybenzoate 3-monooxygenase
MRTQVAIIGGGPAGMLLAEILHQHKIRSVVLEKHSRAHVLARVRAGVLEPSTVEVLRRHGLSARLAREGKPHDGMRMVWAQRGSLFVDTLHHTGQRLTTYGQTSIQEDLYAAADTREAAADARDAALITGAQDVRLFDIDSAQPSLTFVHNGQTQRLDCDFIAGCDGSHGVARSAIPQGAVREYSVTYPYAWLGVLARVPPLPEITYAHHPRGFALASSRSATLSRYYIQTPPDARIEDWRDERFWEELKLRFPSEYARHIVAGPSLEKSLTTLRSVVVEPMQYGRLFLTGDAAHIVPPTGAKGLNLAVSDVFYLSRALVAHYACGDDGDSMLARYSATALRRVWHAVRTSRYLTTLLHVDPAASAFERRAQDYEFEHLQTSDAAQALLAAQYAGLPLES